MRRLLSLAAVAAALSTGGCAVVWDSGGTRRAIGFVSWPLPAPGDAAQVAGVDVIGLGLLATRASTGLVLGWSRERFVGLGAEGFVAVDCLECDLAKTPISTTAPKGPEE